jgi:hypothetical protein
MIYQVVHPYVMSINAESFKTAVKNYVKMNQNLTLTSLIITDQSRQYMKANLNYYNVNDKKKVSISLLPTTWPSVPLLPSVPLMPLMPTLPLGIKKDGEIVSPLNTWPYSPSITYDTKEYPSTTFIEGGFMPRIIPINSTLGPFGPLVSPLSNMMLPNLAGNVYRY